MTERKYSVIEINDLRRAVENKWLWGSYNPHQPMNINGGGGGGSSRSYREEEKTKAVEEIVRTHIIAGHTAEDLYASEQQQPNNRDKDHAGAE